MWYGLKLPEGALKFKNLQENYLDIFRELRSGRVPELETTVSEEVPDLRELLLDFQRRRIEEELTEDLLIVKFGAFRDNLHETINSYYEAVRSLGLVSGIHETSQDPCQFFGQIHGPSHSEELMAQVSRVSRVGAELCQLRKSITEFLSEKARESYPNLSALVGEDLAIDFAVLAGGKRKMVRMPASTIQVIGAEKALFNHLSRGKRPPKHGIIFRFPGLASLPPGKRGKVARIIANKMAIAIRADYHGSRIDTESMRASILAAMKRGSV